MPVPPRRHGQRAWYSLGAGVGWPDGELVAAGPCYPRPAAADRRAAARQVVHDEGMADGRAVTDAREAQDNRVEDPGQGIDVALVEQAVRGELAAFNQLVVRHQDHLFALVYRLVPDRDQAADVVQEAFFSAYRALGSFRGGSVKSWLGRIAVNAAMDLQRCPAAASDPAVPRAGGRELAAAGRADRRAGVLCAGGRAIEGAEPRRWPGCRSSSATASCSSTWTATTTPRSPGSWA